MSRESQAAKNQLDSQALLALRARQEEQIGRHQRLVERVTLALGRPRTIYVTLASVAAWVGFNLLALDAPALSLPVLDPPPFGGMEVVVSLAALLMTSMVLTTQNRQAKHAEQRAHVDLQVNLLAEQKIAKLIALVEELRRDLPGVRDRKDSLADAMTSAVEPDALVSVIEDQPEANGRRAEGSDKGRDGCEGGPRR